MEKCEFSETQFVLGFLRDYFTRLSRPSFPSLYYLIHAPSTATEMSTGSDLIIRHYRKKFLYSEFFQFKRSHLFNSKVFTDKSSKVILDTSLSPKYGFKIYNSRATKQFNVLQKLARKPRKRVFYCAPLFHLNSEFSSNFRSNTIESNSLTFDLKQPIFQSAKIPLGSKHHVIFDRHASHICSDPLQIIGSVASERDRDLPEEYRNFHEDFDFESEIKQLHNFLREEISDQNSIKALEEFGFNYFLVKELLLTNFNIYWIPLVVN